jgi:outer membrane protein
VNTVRTSCLCAALVLLSGTAQAQSAGSIFVTTGWFHLAPQDSSSPFKATSVGGTPVDVTFPGTGATISSADTIGFTAGYFVTDHIAAEFEIGAPPKFDLSGTGQLAQFGKLGTVRQWSPTLLFKYFFREAQAKFRPYVAIGVTHTWFSDASLTNTAFENAALGGPTSVDTSSIWAPVFNAGFTYAFSEHWFAGFSVSYIPMSTTGTFTSQSRTPVGTLTRRSEARITLDPIVTYLRIGYRF